MPVVIIEVAGGIASGKTSLVNLLSSEFGEGIYEEFKNNPFWKQFYEFPDLYAFETEVTFLLQHYSALKNAVKYLGEKALICDYSFVLDLAYADMNLRGEKRKVFDCVYNFVGNEFRFPRLIINLVCDPKVQLERIKGRGRVEEKEISLSYLVNLNQVLSSRVMEVSRDVPILNIDSHKTNFVEDDCDKTRTLRLVRERFQKMLMNI